MGRIYLDHMVGPQTIVCNQCQCPITNRSNFRSSAYIGSTGKANLYASATNLKYSDVQERSMLTGKHYVRDVFCKLCCEKIGWSYEFAVENGQRHKEGKIILERSFIKECKE